MAETLKGPEPLVIEDVTNQYHGLENRWTNDEYLAAQSAKIGPPRYYEEAAIHAIRLINPDSPPDRGVAVIYPFGEGDTYAMRNALCILQAVIPGHPNVYGLMHNARDKVYHTVDQKALDCISEGDFYPYAKDIVKYFEYEGVKELHVVGVQLGASIATVIDQPADDSGYIKIKSKTLVEPPNTEPKTHRQAIDDMLTTARSRNLIRYFRGLQALKQQLDVYLHDIVSQALLDGIGRGNFAQDIEHSDPRTPTVVVNGLKSLVCTSPTAPASHTNTELYSVNGQGAEIIRNPFLVACLARLAIDGNNKKTGLS